MAKFDGKFKQFIWRRIKAVLEENKEEEFFLKLTE